MTASQPSPLELVKLSGESMDPGVDHRSFILGRPTRIGLQVLPKLVLAFFTPVEWTQLNPGHYHDAFHPIHMARLCAELSYRLGRDTRRGLFLQKVALLHDADDRLNLKTGERRPVTPARVQVTLEWMERNRQALCLRLDWDETDFLEAQALIARTDFPFDEQPRTFGTRYDGKSPRELYRELLTALPRERRELAMQDALLLRFADQAGNYCCCVEQSRYYLQGLVDEMVEVGVNVTFEAMARTSPGFIAGIGNDIEADEEIAGGFGLNLSLPTRADLLSVLSKPRLDALLELQSRVLN